MISAGWFVSSLIGIYVLASITWYALGKRRGYRAGLHAPLTTRQQALRTDVERATAAFGAQVPRVRSARLGRRPARRNVE